MLRRAFMLACLLGFGVGALGVGSGCVYREHDDHWHDPHWHHDDGGWHHYD